MVDALRGSSSSPGAVQRATLFSSLTSDLPARPAFNRTAREAFFSKTL
jgi:hypothetical protein